MDETSWSSSLGAAQQRIGIETDRRGYRFKNVVFLEQT
mgnify:CR=1 FL=1